MPQVPVYGDRQVRTQALQPVMQQAVDVSSGARALAQGLGQVAEAADRIDLRDAQAKASSAEATITSDWLKWDSENRNKFRGENADGYAPAAEAWWKSAAENAGKDLDPRAKSLASQSLRAKQTAALGNVQTFTMAEKERHADESYAADVNTTIQFGVTSGDVASTAVQIRDKAALLGARKGWTTEQVQAEAGKNLSMMHLAQITKLAELDATKAQEYYDANKAEVGFQNQARVEQVLKGEGDNQFATQFAAQNADKPLTEQIKLAGEITDPKRREKTITQLRLNHALVKEAQAEKESQASDTAWQMAAKGQRIPELVLSQMNGRERLQLQEHITDRAKRLAEGKSVKTNVNELARILDMAREDPEQFSKLKLTTLTEKIAGSDIEQLGTLQRTMGKDKAVVTSSQLVGSYTKDMPTPKKAAFEQTFYNQLFAFKEEKGRGPTDKEQKAIIDDLMMRRENSWYQFGETRKWQMSDEDKAKATFVPGPSASTPAKTADQFTAGQIYRDKSGNRARYLGNGKWEPL